MADSCTVDAATGTLTVWRTGWSDGWIEIDISDIYPRFVYNGTSIDKIMMPSEGCEISIDEWMLRTSGDPNVFKNTLSDGRLASLSFKIGMDTISVELIPHKTMARPNDLFHIRRGLAGSLESITSGIDVDLLSETTATSTVDVTDYIWGLLEQGKVLLESDMLPREYEAACRLFDWGLACRVDPDGGDHYIAFAISDVIQSWINEEVAFAPDPSKTLMISPMSDAAEATLSRLGQNARAIGVYAWSADGNGLAIPLEERPDPVRGKVMLPCAVCGGHGKVPSPFTVGAGDPLAKMFTFKGDAHPTLSIECAGCNGSGKVVGYK